MIWDVMVTLPNDGPPALGFAAITTFPLIALPSVTVTGYFNAFGVEPNSWFSGNGFAGVINDVALHVMVTGKLAALNAVAVANDSSMATTETLKGTPATWLASTPLMPLPVAPAVQVCPGATTKYLYPKTRLEKASRHKDINNNSDILDFIKKTSCDIVDNLIYLNIIIKIGK
jgi:hypothetical protein